MKRTAAGAALVASLLVGAPAVANAAPGPAVPVAAVAPAQDGGESEPPPPTDPGEEPPPPTSPWRDRVDAAFERAITRVQASQIPPRQKQRAIRVLERFQMRWR